MTAHGTNISLIAHSLQLRNVGKVLYSLVLAKVGLNQKHHYLSINPKSARKTVQATVPGDLIQKK